MLPPAPVLRLRPPVPPEPPPRAGFPWLATMAPVLLSVVIWQVTGLLLSLLFALLGPLIAVAGVLDGRLSRRRAARRNDTDRAAEAARLRQRIADAHVAERDRLAALCAPGTAWRAATDAPLPVRLGVAPCVADIELEGHPSDDDALTADLRAAADLGVPSPFVADAFDGVGVTGPPVLAAAAVRSVALQVAARLPPVHARLTAPGGEAWVQALPHAVDVGADGVYRWIVDDGEVVLAWARSPGDLPAGLAVVVDCVVPGLRIDAAAREAALHEAERLAARARDLGLAAPGSPLPDAVPLGDLLREVASTPSSGLTAVLGRDERGPVLIDLVTDGPHALVAGTTGSGKSELLVSWILAMAHGRTPDDVGFLLVDFKGGSAFAPLARMPHVLEVLSDLEPVLARRTIASLRAELLRRERILATAGARSIDELPPGELPRLVVVIDEYAALAAAMPELHEAVGDLAARGRSLGLHLVLCTQRPSGVVRDAVLANVGLRVSLRVADRADSIAVVGDDSAARLPASPRGRAMRSVGGAPARGLQVAISAPADIVAAAAAPAARHPVPWCPPLPTLLELDALPSSEGLAFGLVDLPHEQRQPVAAHDPGRHGHLLVLGASGAGVSTALAALTVSGERSGMRVLVLPDEPADAWGVLSGLGARASGERVLLVADDLDVLLARTGDEHRTELGDLLAGLLRSNGAAGVAVVAGARRSAGPLSALASLFGSRLVLRQASRDDHVLAGGSYEGFDPAAPPGRGRWRDHDVQVARSATDHTPRAATRPALPRVRPRPGAVLAVVAARPGPITARLHAAGVRVLRVGADASGDALRIAPGAEAVVVLGDPDAWQADWTLLTLVRRTWPMVFTGCTSADLRALRGIRSIPPPLGPDPRECWLVDDDTVARARLDLDSSAT